MGLLTPEGPAVNAEEEAFIRTMQRRKKKKRNHSIFRHDNFIGCFSAD
ncbi:relaxase, partial [Prevotella sp. MGM1]